MNNCLNNFDNFRWKDLIKKNLFVKYEINQ